MSKARTLMRLSVRNLLRARRRSALTAVAVIAAVGLSLLGRGFLDGTDEAVIRGAIDGTVGHVTARPAGYPARGMQHPVDELLEVNEPTQELLERAAEGWTARTLFAPRLTHRGDSLRVRAIGFDPVTDATVFPRTHWRVEGELPAAGEREIGVSPFVARLLELAPGDLVVVQVRTHQGAINALQATVSGVVRTGNMALDFRGIWVPGPLAVELVRAEAPSHLSARLPRRGAAPDFAAVLQQTLGEQAEVVTWQTETEDLLRLQSIRRSALSLVVFILLALSAFGIANTVLMAAHERVREVGTLRSLGMSEGDIVLLFLIEGSFVGLFGGVVGALLSGGLLQYWSRNPIDLEALMDLETASYSMAPLIYTRVDPASMVLGVALAILVAALASVYPARVAARVVPADAVKAD
jgi:putative ABC transport system permease protein